VDLQLGTEDDGTGTGDSAGTGSKVDAILSRREQLKQHVHSKLAKLRSIRLLDPPKTNNTSQVHVVFTTAGVLSPNMATLILKQPGCDFAWD